MERCAVCGFDESRWDDQDTVNTLRGLAIMWAWTLEGLGPELAGRRPEPDTWSVAEYTDHAADTVWAMRFVVDLATDDPGHDLGPAVAPASPGPRRDVDLDGALGRLLDETTALFDRARDLDADGWTRTVRIGGEVRDVRWALHHALHDVLHHQHDIGRIRVRLGAGAPPARGVLGQISVSDGGVPKNAVARAEIGWRGVEGDRQAARQHHGRPVQALCLWSLDVIEALRVEGHPIAAGSAGENLTVSGLDWASIRPGTVLEVGDVRCEVRSYATPCTKNGRWFADGDSARIDHGRHPGWSRVYAEVVRPGAVAVGDEVRVEPPD